MDEMGKLLVFAGLLLALAGAAAAAWCLGRWGFQGLPGDLRYEAGNVRVYVPIVTCVALSALMTALLWLWQRLSRR